MKKKIKKAECAPKVVDGNGVLGLLEYVLLPASQLKTGKKEFIVKRERDGLEPLVYTSIQQAQDDYKNDIVRPQVSVVRAKLTKYCSSHPNFSSRLLQTVL